MFTVLATFEVTDRAATDNDEAALTGTAEFPQNGHHQVLFDAHLLAVMVMGISTSRCRISVPSVNRVCQLDVWPFERAAIPSEYSAIMDLRRTPIPLRRSEEIIVRHSGNGTTGTNENWTTCLFVGDPVPIIPSYAGEISVLRLTGSTTLVANAWTNVALTASEALPAGLYEIIGMNAWSTNAQAARLVIQGNPVNTRPGVICSNATGFIVPSYLFWDGAFGSYGRFPNNILPSVEFLSNAADTTQEVLLKIRKIG